jgi:hypothetical protein
MAENPDDDKLFDKINARTNKNTGVVEVKIIPQPKVVTSAQKTIDVVLLNPSNNSIVLDRSNFPLIDGKVPVKMIMTSWKVKKPTWVDVKIVI